MCYKKSLLLIYLLLSVFAYSSPLFSQESDKVLIGVQTSFSGGGEHFGIDLQNALNFANHKFFNDKYKFVFEDEECSAKGGLNAAQRLVSVHKVKYVLGPACNQSIIQAAPVYNKAKVPVLTSVATSGDILDIGDYIFRMFPADYKGVEKIYPYIVARHKHLAIITAQSEYPVMMERTFQKIQAKEKSLQKITSEFVIQEGYDYRSTLLKLKNSGADALFTNFDGESGYMESVKQTRELGWNVPIYATYFPASKVTMDNLGKLNEGVIFANTPLIESSLTPESKQIYDEFVAKYKDPLSISLAVALSIESLRVLDKAINSGQPILAFLKANTFPSMIGDLSFDKYGAIKGIDFQIQKIQDGKVVIVER